MISVLVPTRNRPANVTRLLTSIFDTARTEVEVLFYVDDDEPSTLTLNNIYAGAGKAVVGPRKVLSESWNRLWHDARFDVAMHCGDDIIFRTNGWDERVLEEFDKFDDKIVFVHGRDGFQDERMGTHGFLHRNWVETVGYFVPPYFSSDYNDTWLTEVADALGRRRYVPDVYTEHMHPVAGKGEWDATHQERLTRHKRDNVDDLYRTYADKRREDVTKLNAFIGAFHV